MATRNRTAQVRTRGVRPLKYSRQFFDQSSWRKRILGDPKRIYAFLFCTNVHKPFISFVQDSWETLDHLSGTACDIFTFEPAGHTTPAFPICPPKRHQCHDILRRLFDRHEDIELPGFAVFPASKKESLYYSCSGKNSTELEELFRTVLFLIEKAYSLPVAKTGSDVFAALKTFERERRIKEVIAKKLKMTLKDVASVLRESLQLATWC